MRDRTMPSAVSRQDTTIEQTEPLMAGDIRELLASFVAAIELDQHRVATLSACTLHIYYDASIWTQWRSDHLTFIKKLMKTVGEIEGTVLSDLTKIARSYDAAVVTVAILELFAQAASGSVDETELLPAGRFFEHLIHNISRIQIGLPPANASVRSLVAAWLPMNDPLRIALDPECGYRIPMQSN